MNTKNKVDEYINSFPADIQFKLQAIRMLIFKLAPEVDESFSYGMPAYKIFKKPLIYYAAYKNQSVVEHNLFQACRLRHRKHNEITTQT